MRFIKIQSILLACVCIQIFNQTSIGPQSKKSRCGRHGHYIQPWWEREVLIYSNLRGQQGWYGVGYLCCF